MLCDGNGNSRESKREDRFDEDRKTRKALFQIGLSPKESDELFHWLFRTDIEEEFDLWVSLLKETVQMS